MLLNGNGSSGESCTKRSDGHSSGTSSPHSDPNQSFNTQSKANLGYPSFPPPGTIHSFSFYSLFLFHTFAIFGKAFSLHVFLLTISLNDNNNESFFDISSKLDGILTPSPGTSTTFAISELCSTNGNVLCTNESWFNATRRSMG